MRHHNHFFLITYITIFCFLVLLIPLYGDPAVVFWTSKVMLLTGFPYDPVCSKNVMHAIGSSELILCVRAPLYYLLLGFFGDYYKFFLISLFSIYSFFQALLAREMNTRLSAISLMLPPIYLLFSRTYVDGLTAVISAALILAILWKDKPSKFPELLLFLCPLLMVLVRETAMLFPLFLVILLFFRRRVSKDFGLMTAGWLIGMLLYGIFIKASSGVVYSDFQPHLPSYFEIYAAAMNVLTPILPWEIYQEDIISYLPLQIADQSLIDLMTTVIRAMVNILSIFILVPIVFFFRRWKYVDQVVKSQLVFGFFMVGGVLFVKGYIDFFRHTSYLLAVAAPIVEIGLHEVERGSKVVAHIIRGAYVILFLLWSMRVIRLFLSGYSFDTCSYLLKRPEIASKWFFYETACK